MMIKQFFGLILLLGLVTACASAEISATPPSTATVKPATPTQTPTDAPTVISKPPQLVMFWSAY
ncbi:MAG: hypothetical protein ACPG8W_19295 [Candidatus Promineifilaceae bacterium]